MKKYVSMTLALVLIVCLLSVNVFAASDNMKLSVSNASVECGETITISVKTPAEAKFASFELTVNYPADLFELVSVSSSFDKAPATYDGELIVTSLTMEDTLYAADTELMTATLKAKEGVSGSDAIEIAVCKLAVLETGAAVNFGIPGGVTVTVTAPCTHANTEIRDAKEATCTEKGYTGDTWCKDCETKIATGEEIDMIPHTPAEEKVGVKSATCGADGYTGDVVCSVCKTVIEKGEVVKATGKHVDENKDNKCDVCQKDLTPASSGSDVTITQKPVKMYFNDVKPSDWFYEDVLYVYTHGLMVGVSDSNFAPMANLTRGMLVTILYRMEGEPAVKFASTFGDVADDLWYSDAVEWAAKNDIVKGYETGKFGPNDAITREQLATILYRYAKYQGYDVSAAADLDDFTDAAQVSDYAVSAVKWAVASGLLKGADGKLMPKANATRAEVAALIHRFDEKF